MKLLVVCAVVIFVAQVPQALSGVIMLTPNGLSYLNQDQYTQEKEMIIPQTGQGEWRNEPNNGEGPPYQSEDRSDQDDDDEVEGDDEDKDNEDEAEEKEVPEKDADDEEEIEEKDNEDEAEVEKEKEDGAEVEKEELDDDKPEGDSEEEAEPKNDHELAIHSLKQKDKIAKLKAQDSEEAASDDEPESRPPPPPPADLVNKMEYEQMYGQYEQPASPPLLSRMTSLLTSIFKGGQAQNQYSQPQNQYGQDPFYSSRGAKSITAQRANSKVQKEPTTATSEVVSRKRRDAPVLSRTKRQLNMRALNLAPFYHVRNNIRTTVRRQPLAKLAPQPLNDFSSELSEKASKPIKLIMEPYSAPQTLQNPAALSPKEGVRGPGTGTSSAAAPSNGAGTGANQGQGQGAGQSGNKGASQGNKKNSGGNKKNNNANKNKESEEEDGDSDENSSQQGQDPFDYESDNEIASEEDLNKSEADDEQEEAEVEAEQEKDAHEEQDDEEEDY